MTKTHQISTTLRVRLGDWGIFNGVLILEEKRKQVLWHYWKRLDFTIPKIHTSIDDAIDYLLRRNKSAISTADMSNIFKNINHYQCTANEKKKL